MVSSSMDAKVPARHHRPAKHVKPVFTVWECSLLQSVLQDALKGDLKGERAEIGRTAIQKLTIARRDSRG